MQRQGKKGKKGFTLIELVIVIVILTIISSIAAKVLSSGFNSYFDNQNIVNANEQGRLALERMSRDIHAINSTSSISTMSGSTLTFVDTTGTTITYTVSGTSLQRNGTTLADGVSSLAFGYYGSNGAVTATAANVRYINVTLTITQSGVNYTVATTISTLNYI